MKRLFLVFSVITAIFVGNAAMAATASAGCTGVASSTVYAPSGSYNLYFNVQAQNCTSDVYDVRIAQCPGYPSGVAAGWIDSTAGGFRAVCQQTQPRTLSFTTRCDQQTGACIRDNYTNVVRYTATCWYWQQTHWLLPMYQIQWRITQPSGLPSGYSPWQWVYGTGSYVPC